METDFKILIALDSSNHSKNTVEYGLYLSKRLQAKVGLLYVVDKNKEMGSIDAGILPEDAKEKLRNEAIMHVFEIIKTHDINIEQFIVNGDPLKEMLRTVKKWNANMLIIGMHSNKSLFSFLKSSFTEQIIENTTIPVTVVSDKMKW